MTLPNINDGTICEIMEWLNVFNYLLLNLISMPSFLPFSSQCSLLIPLKISENQTFSELFRGIQRNIGKKRVKNLLTHFSLCSISMSPENLFSDVFRGYRFLTFLGDFVTEDNSNGKRLQNT